MTKCNLHILLYEVLKLQNAASQHWVICSTWYFHHGVFATQTIVWLFCSNAFLFISSFPAETLEKSALPTGKCFASCFACLIIRDHRLSTRFPKTDSVLQMLCGRWSKSWSCIALGLQVGHWRELLEGKSLQENDKVCSRRSGESDEYFVSPRNTTVILISTSIRYDIVLVQNKTNRSTVKNMPWTLLYKNTRSWFWWFYVKVQVQISLQPKFRQNQKNTLSHVFLSRVTNIWEIWWRFHENLQ